MIVAVVLAAGESSRMGRPKALLPIGGKSFIEAIVMALRQTRIAKILIVLGHHAEDLKPQIEGLPVTILINSEYRLGQLSSLQVAVRHLMGLPDFTGVDGILVHLVDHPYLNPALVNRMIEGFYNSGKLIVLPRYGSHHGHPVIFSARLFGELLQAPLEQGAKAVVNAHRDDTLELETDDAGIAIDIDTPDEYRRYVKEE
jgi:molybdenum cofactor cytidylyltransferase